MSESSRQSDAGRWDEWLALAPHLSMYRWFLLAGMLVVGLRFGGIVLASLDHETSAAALSAEGAVAQGATLVAAPIHQDAADDGDASLGPAAEIEDSRAEPDHASHAPTPVPALEDPPPVEVVEVTPTGDDRQVEAELARARALATGGGVTARANSVSRMIAVEFAVGRAARSCGAWLAERLNQYSPTSSRRVPPEQSPLAVAPVANSPRRNYLVLVNPAAWDTEVRYLIDGQQHSLPPGQTHRLRVASSCRIYFHRGDDFGFAALELSQGEYAFQLTPAGWDLATSR